MQLRSVVWKKRSCQMTELPSDCCIVGYWTVMNISYFSRSVTMHYGSIMAQSACIASYKWQGSIDNAPNLHRYMLLTSIKTMCARARARVFGFNQWYRHFAMSPCSWCGWNLEWGTLVRFVSRFDIFSAIYLSIYGVGLVVKLINFDLR